MKSFTNSAIAWSLAASINLMDKLCASGWIQTGNGYRVIDVEGRVNKSSRVYYEPIDTVRCRQPAHKRRDTLRWRV
ncbi:MAG: hypothetical protein AB1631_27145 [Acidobacteriota bacterium]